MRPDHDDVSADLRSPFLNLTDFTDVADQLFTIASVETVHVPPRNGQPGKNRWVLSFHGGRRFGLNPTNLKVLAAAYGPHALSWAGKAIVIYLDQTVAHAGRQVGGLRVRAPSPDRAHAVEDAPP